MITDEIQELLDGGLGDERTAELLHSLSVSPEKRAAFQQHLGLRAAIQRDRLASTLTGAEDAALWASIAGTSTVPHAVAATSARMWLTRGAALLATGIACYLLGTTTIDDTTIASSNARADRGNVATEIVRNAPAPSAAGLKSDAIA